MPDQNFTMWVNRFSLIAVTFYFLLLVNGIWALNQGFNGPDVVKFRRLLANMKYPTQRTSSVGNDMGMGVSYANTMNIHYQPQVSSYPNAEGIDARRHDLAVNNRKMQKVIVNLHQQCRFLRESNAGLEKLLREKTARNAQLENELRERRDHELAGIDMGNVLVQEHMAVQKEIAVLENQFRTFHKELKELKRKVPNICGSEFESDRRQNPAYSKHLGQQRYAESVGSARYPEQDYIEPGRTNTGITDQGHIYQEQPYAASTSSSVGTNDPHTHSHRHSSTSSVVREPGGSHHQQVYPSFTSDADIGPEANHHGHIAAYTNANTAVMKPPTPYQYTQQQEQQIPILHPNLNHTALSEGKINKEELYLPKPRLHTDYSNALGSAILDTALLSSPQSWATADRGKLSHDVFRQTVNSNNYGGSSTFQNMEPPSYNMPPEKPLEKSSPGPTQLNNPPLPPNHPTTQVSNSAPSVQYYNNNYYDYHDNNGEHQKSQ